MSSSNSSATEPTSGASSLTHSRPTTSGAVSSVSAPSSSTSSTAASGASPSLVVPRSSVEFFASAAPKLHAYVRDIQRENDALRAQNDQLRSDASILDSISDFLREMSKTDMNYKQFMKFKTKEVEDAKKAKATASGNTDESVRPQAEGSASTTTTALPPVKMASVKVASNNTSAHSSLSSASTSSKSSSSSSGMFTGVKGGFFNKPTAVTATAPVQAFSTTAPAPASSHPATRTNEEAALPSIPAPTPAVDPSTFNPRKKPPSQKRPPPPPAGHGAHYTFSAPNAENRNPPLRHVTPYKHEYSLFVKRRWIGRTLLEVLVSDFKLSSSGEDNEDAEDNEGDAAASAEEAGGSSAAEKFYRNEISSGAILLNSKPASPDVVLKSGDHILHYSHKHEPPVLNEAWSEEGKQDFSIQKLFEDEHVVVVNKPCGIPVHESGKYRHNSLLGILYSQATTSSKQQQQPQSTSSSNNDNANRAHMLYPVHRLDKVTSGVVILAKDSTTASKFGRCMKHNDDEDAATDVETDADAKSHSEGAAASPSPSPSSLTASPQELVHKILHTKTARKIYVARVKGRFPTTLAEFRVAAPQNLAQPGITLSEINFDDHEVGLNNSQELDEVYQAGGLSVLSSNATRFFLSAPIWTVSLRRGLHCIDAARGKRAASLFRCLGYDATSDTSVVEVQPLTGRTHQIRLHLSFMNFPIINDPIYGGVAYEGNTYSSIPLESHPDPDVAQQRAPAYESQCRDCAKHLYYDRAADKGLRYCTGIYLHALSYSYRPLVSPSDAASVPIPAFAYRSALPLWAQGRFDVRAALGNQVKTSERAEEVIRREAMAATEGQNASTTPAVTLSSSSLAGTSTSSTNASTSEFTFSIQPCLPRHMDQVAAIYAHWVATGTGTFEESAPSVEEMKQRREDLVNKQYPFIVATRVSSSNPREVSEEQVIGYAYAGPFRLRSAYRFTVEDSIYIHPDFANNKRIPNSPVGGSPGSPTSKSSIGHALLTELIRLCQVAGYRRMLSLIGDSQNSASIRLHEKLGFSHSGNMKDVGFKFQRWLDVVIMQLELNPTTTIEPSAESQIDRSENTLIPVASPTPSNPQRPHYRRLEYQGGQLIKHEDHPESAQ